MQLHYEKAKNAEQAQRLSRLEQQLSLKTREQEKTKAENVQLSLTTDRQNKVMSCIQSKNNLLEKQLHQTSADNQRLRNEVANLESVFHKTVEIKLQYEGMLRKLLEDPEIVGKVTSILNQVQPAAPA